MLLNCGVGENPWESLGLQGDPTNPSQRKSVLNIHWKDWFWSWNPKTLATWCEELTYLEDPDARKDWKQKETGMREDEMVGWHHRLNRHELEQTLGVCDGQGGLACCSPWGCKELDVTEWLNWTESCFLGRKAMTNIHSILKITDISLLTEVCILKGMVFSVIMCACQSWTIKKF